jgi:hypothetical protein
MRQHRYFQAFLPRTPESRYIPGETHLYLGRRYRLKVERGGSGSVKLIRGFLIVGLPEAKTDDGGYRFRAAKDAQALRDVVTFHWEMLPANDEAVVARGFEFLIVDGSGRILVDYQFFLGRVAAAA